MGYELNFAPILTAPYLGFLITGVKYTLALFAGSWIIAVILATFLTTLRATGFKPFVWLISAYVAYHRNVPLLVQILVWYIGAASFLPRDVNMFFNRNNPEFLFALIALSLYSAAYMSEDMRSGIRAIPRTQMEAARSIGFSFMQSMRWVILPQTWRVALPPLINQTLLLFKGTSLAAAIGVAELTYQARQIETQTFRIFESFAVVTALYLIGSFALMFLGAWSAKKFKLRTK
ncbi:amino acid ABC transporter permease [Aureimonas fodinaquatilis]|uniref:Amino acid ABC transporter permease n=1 Tax=Aureimonas fodinaquatilis TaxID=2565783 RepID=A0A5B0DS70_9HYPH|nr:amino acid ABC transporter permease [Aureimonas fodinaquatilis]KAA0969647.1 amino acid ABC transporter permease [Aureimonas fodinaquatilis]